MKNLMEAALSYAAKGYLVFPCKPRSKVPATPNGFKDATTDQERIREWWKQNPKYNVAIRTGPDSGVMVLDVDGEAGEHTLGGRGTLPATVTAKTGRGWHYYLRHPQVGIRSSIGRLGDGLDVKADGGYVLAPPSVHPDGSSYEWAMSLEDAQLAECPAWLSEAVSGRCGWRRVALSAPIEEGKRNTELTRVGGLFRREGYDFEDLLTALMMHNERRCSPPLPADEVEAIARSIMRYEPEEELSLSPSPKGDDSDDSLPEVRKFKDMTPPQGPRPYIVDGVLFEGFAGAIYGDGGSAKSMLVMHMGQCVARGDKWLGFDTVKTNVLYLDFELDGEEQSRRAYQIAAGDGYTEPPEGFFYISAAGYPTHAIFEHALNVCVVHGIGMVIVDSLSYALEGDAEASRDVLKFFREVEGAFRREGITLLIVDHQAKQQVGGRYQDKTMFGSVYKSNSIRSVFQVEPGDHEDGSLPVIIRHKKVNFGPLLKPFGVQVMFDTKAVKVNTRELDSTELAQERRLNAQERVLLVLEDVPMYPEDIAVATGLELGTVKNALTKLRKAGKVEATGNKAGRGGSEEVSLTELSSLSLPLADSYSDSSEEALVRTAYGEMDAVPLN